MIDPIVPLTSSIGLKKGIYAFFLGSGISKGAGVPTGNEIAKEASKDLYKLRKEKSEVDEDRFDQWLQKQHYTYSEVLEALYKTQADRREYHENFFQDIDPSQAHIQLAKLVKECYVKVIITTNFDPLMEKALDDEGVTHHVVKSGNDIKNIPPREHSECYVLKLHGSWEKTNLKVTQDEIEELDPAIKKELQHILNRYGIVVLGYSGSDEEVMNSFQRSDPFYGLYWVKRGSTNDSVQQLVNDKNGFFIQRQTADDFLSELTRKIQILEHQRPEKRSPGLVASETQSFVRENDSVAIENQMRESYRRVESKIIEITTENSEVKGRDSIQKVIHKVENASDELIAIGMPLIGHNQIEHFNQIKKLLVRLRDISLETDKTAILESPWLVLYNAIMIWGTLALRNRDFEKLKSIFNISVPLPNETRTYQFEEVLSKIHYSYASKAVTEDGSARELTRRLDEKYSESEIVSIFSYSVENWRSSLTQFQFLLALFCTTSEICSLPLISLSMTRSEKAVWEFINDVRYEKELCERVADLFNESCNSFRENIPSRFEVLLSNIPSPLGGRVWIRLHKHLQNDWS